MNTSPTPRSGNFRPGALRRTAGRLLLGVGLLAGGAILGRKVFDVPPRGDPPAPATVASAEAARATPPPPVRSWGSDETAVHSVAAPVRRPVAGRKPSPSVRRAVVLPATPPRPLAEERLAPARPDDARLLAAARDAASGGDCVRAVADFDAYLARNPDDRRARRELAAALAAAGNARRAREQYDRLLTAEPHHAELLVLAGDACVSTRDYPEAVARYSSALEALPDNREVAVRLARAYALTGDFTRAGEVYERHLSACRPGDPRTPRALGALLLDLDRPAEALPFLRSLQRSSPKDPEVIASLIRATARLGERPQAVGLLRELAERPTRPGVRAALAQSLSESEEFELAGQVYGQILQAEPNDGPARVGLARVYLALFQPANARAVLDGFTPSPAVRRSYLLAFIQYHRVVGEYAEAKRFCLDLLRQSPADDEARLALAALYEAVGEYDQAEAELAKVNRVGRGGRVARLRLAEVLARQRRFPEALALARALLAEAPDDAEVAAQLVRHLSGGGGHAQAEATARAFLRRNSRGEIAAMPVRLALGRVLIDAGRFAEAVREYERILARPWGRVPAAYYGLARVLERSGGSTRAAQVVACVTGLRGDTRNRLLLADLFERDGDDRRAAEVARAVLQSDPKNLAALVRVADASARLARLTGRPESAEAARRVLSLSPTNVRGHLALARSLAAARDFAGAVAHYDRLLALDPEIHVAAREREPLPDIQVRPARYAP